MLSGLKKIFFPVFLSALCLFFPACKSAETPRDSHTETETVLLPEIQEIPPVEEPVIPDREQEVEEQPSPEEQSIEDDENTVVVTVDSVEITMHEFKQTKSEIEIVVDDLNKITKDRNYSKWLTYLDPEYRKTLSSKNYLDRVSKSLPMALQERNIRLTSLEDYFKYVFVPSRQNIRVDDIRFITPTRVYVIMEISRGQRAAVYILEKRSDGEWKLVGKN